MSICWYMQLIIINILYLFSWGKGGALGGLVGRDTALQAGLIPDGVIGIFH
jgi:hypothetical protein